MSKDRLDIISGFIGDMKKDCNAANDCKTCPRCKVCSMLDTTTPFDLEHDLDVIASQLFLIGGYKIDNKSEILKNALMKYGERTQLDMVIEEMAELTQAISKFKRGKDHNIEEEVADVEIMLEQVRMMSLVDTKKIDEIKQQKLIRLGKRLDGNE